MKAIIVTGDDYAATYFEEQFAGWTVKEVIDHVEEGGQTQYYSDEGFFEITVENAGEHDKYFLSTIRSFVIDYDSTKYNNFWMEDETI